MSSIEIEKMIVEVKKTMAKKSSCGMATIVWQDETGLVNWSFEKLGVQVGDSVTLADGYTKAKVHFVYDDTAPAAPISIEFDRELMQVENRIREKGAAGAVKLLYKMIELAESNHAYSHQFASWLKGEQSTMAIRRLGEGFKNLFENSNDHWNAVHCLDSAQP